MQALRIPEIRVITERVQPDEIKSGSNLMERLLYIRNSILQVDEDKSGSIEFNEFLEMMKKKMKDNIRKIKLTKI